MNRKQRRSMLIGTLLGDSSFMGKKNKAIYFGHCEKQRQYGEWKLYLLAKFFNVSTKSCLAKGMTTPYGHRTNFYKFWTTVDHRFTSLYKRMIVDGKKDITGFSLKYFNEVSLAFLFMDDGCKETFRGKIKTFKISLGNFPYDSVVKLSNHIKEKLDLDSKIYLEHGKHPCLKFTKKDNRTKFIELIKPYIHQCMLYKIQQ